MSDEGELKKKNKNKKKDGGDNGDEDENGGGIFGGIFASILEYTSKMYR